MTPITPGTSATPLPPEDRLARMEQIVLALAQQDPAPVHRSDHVEPVVWLLIATTMALVVVLVAVSKWSPDDGQTFQCVAGLATGFAGAVLARIKPAEPKKAESAESK